MIYISIIDREACVVMDKYNKIHLGALLKALFVKIFGNKFCMAALDLLMTVIISLHTSNMNFKSQVWICKLFLYVGLAIAINGICILADHMRNTTEKTYKFYDDAYSIQNKINYKTATYLYRVNKRISRAIKEKKIEIGAFNSIADFQSLSFIVCNELCDFIVATFGCDCEVTIFQRFTDTKNKDFVKMIAFKNNKNHQPSTYGKEFKLSLKDNAPVFISVFNDLNEEIKILHNKKAVESEFKYFEGSKNREQEICQYIGIPIKTNRGKIEIVLQLDVSKSKALGKNYNQLKQFAEYILLPFCSLLHCSFERDLILNKFYDILEENISKSS